ncbi:NTP pyrophosphohydrolase [[Actinomadura] parvosata subsp. kistnae]|uniref:NUDIX hydrolase n=1 Tax=[Actinomadura] parvosata subsp. kistnae TaxID=1909395 RepID=A0A1V0ABW8_9ACTN|nr:NUDIX hydrolase [Nonomuraea sp. ATCC 55076]AQZ67659.1 NUDIX hydrolase [Nonomuraea sp. ATCC 55076]SPL94054.1 NTP pyrophosphohydrolase [Actinomadura parvosata subsp. kistnae]
MAAKDGDGWAECAQGHRHWGVHGASGLLVVHHDEAGVPYVLMQKRSWWSHHGGTWGLPGGARDSHEDAVTTALREAREEAALAGDGLRVQGVYLDDHGGWAFETVIAESAELLAAVPANRESTELRWLPLPEVAERKLHPGFAATWSDLQGAIRPETVVLDVANIVGARAEHGWWNDRLGAATRLLHDVSGLRLAHPVLAQWYPRMVAVVEGAARSAPAVQGVHVVAATGSGDDAIVDVVRQAKPWERVLVVTADRALKERVTGLGAETVGPKWLLSQLGG